MRALGAMLFLSILFASCGKHLPDLPNAPFDYSVWGINDLTIPANDFGWFATDVKVLTGDPGEEPITVTFENVPPNVFIGNSAGSFKANYRYSDSFGVRNGMPGVYPMKAVFSNKTTGVRKYDFNLVITDPVNRVNNFYGGYYPSGNCGYSIYVTCQMDSIPGRPGELRIIDRHSDSYSHYGTFDTTYAVVDCCTNTFIIPSQNVQGTTVEGSGYLTTYGGRRIIVERHFTNDSLDYHCTVTLQN
jgi:hypothetical protein